MKPRYLILFPLFCSLFLFSCGKQVKNIQAPSPTPRLIEIPLESRPYVSLISREDGHMLYLKIDKIPANISQIDYEVLYTASDGGNEIEKGAGDTIKEISSSLERKILLGTESCTNGCKYKFDEGVFGGTISLTFTTKDSQVSTYESQFSLKSGKQINTDGEIGLSTENIVIKSKPKDNLFYILLKNYGINTANTKSAYTIFSSSPSTAKYISIEPATVTKNDSNLTGEYLIN